jgi:hypothetical protein
MNMWTGSGLDYGMFNIPGSSFMFQHSPTNPSSMEAIGVAVAMFAVIAGIMFVASKANKKPSLNS